MNRAAFAVIMVDASLLLAFAVSVGLLIAMTLS
jgi:hypothetical protein